MKEIGSFIELQLASGHEWYTDRNFGSNIIRLNSGRAAIYHAIRCLGVSKVYIPYYQCDTVRDFLRKKNIDYEYYHIDNNFEPLIAPNPGNSAMLIVNYYGIMSHKRMISVVQKYKNVIIDNSQAFFSSPIDCCMNVYSARKFMGVPDGAYVIGENANRYIDEYEQCYSSDTSLFLLQRIEYGCEGKTYINRMINEERINNEDIMKMSPLTRYLLDGTDYNTIIKKRRLNFNYARQLFDNMNRICMDRYIGYDIVPMVYPLVIEDENVMKRLINHKHFQGHWWGYILNEVDRNCFEYYISKYIIPITIDQRYNINDLRYIYNIVKGLS